LNDLFRIKKKSPYSSADSDSDDEYTHSESTFYGLIDVEKAEQRQLQKLKSCEIRYAILSSELHEVSLKGQLLANRKKKISHGMILLSKIDTSWQSNKLNYVHMPHSNGTSSRRANED
jgi:hypothetical protein